MFAKALAAGGAAVAGMVIVLTLPVWPAVTVSSEKATVAVLESDTFSISYVHSIDGLPIEEYLRAAENELIVERTRLRQFGAGMGHIEGQGQGHSEGRWWVLDNMERHIGPEMHLRIGPASVDHRLYADGAELRLSDCLAGERVTVSAKPVSALTLLRGPTDFGCGVSTQ